MKLRPALLLLTTGLFLVAAFLRAADQPPAPPAAKSRLAERIDALLRPHLKPAPLPVTLPNPFIVTRGSADFTDAHEPAGAAAAPRAAPPADDFAPLTDAEVLARCVAHLRIGGTMQTGDVTQLLINQELYKEGDYVILDGKGALVYVQILRLTPGEITLRYKEATQVIRLKNPARPRDAGP